MILNRLELDARLTWANLICSQGYVLFTQDYVVAMFHQRKKERQRAFLNENFISICPCLCLRSRHIQFLIQGKKCTSDLKKARLYQPVQCRFFKHFTKSVRNAKNRLIQIVFQYKSTIKTVFFYWIPRTTQSWLK